MPLRLFEAAWIGLALCTTTTALAAQQPPLTTTLLMSGLNSPTDIGSPPGDSNRLFVAEQRVGTNGRVRVFDRVSGTLHPAPYLSIPVSTGVEQGLLGFAFHPNFASNGYLYVDYTNPAGDTVVARYQANAPYMTSTTANPASVQIVLTIAQPFANHNGGWIGFGPDGNLYIASGDGGSAQDSDGNAQSLDTLLGKILRVNVNSDDFPGDSMRNYAIPSTNPFAGAQAGRDEIWHYGLRNPWRASFDRSTGDLYIGDVGEGAREEIDFQPAGLGGQNFGWRCMEGTLCTGLSGCTCATSSLTMPIHEYPHGTGACSVIGGYTYRGSAICGLAGTYFFADFCTDQIWTLRYTSGGVTDLRDRTAELAPGGGLSLTSISSFGQDANGEILICDRNGEIFQVVAGAITDCNSNGEHDGCDIDGGMSFDLNANQLPDECESIFTPYCFGDGTAGACPCSNFGTSGRGCANSVVTQGGRIFAGGIASVSADSLVLQGWGMPNSYALFYQGTAQVNGGLGAGFGDGLRCVGGAIMRLGLRVNAAGLSTFPAAGGPSISQQTGVTAGGQTRNYQIWYRNAASGFCTASTFNLTNGLAVTWLP